MKTASISLLQLLLAVSILNATVFAAAQGDPLPEVITSPNDGSVTIDGFRLTSVTKLDAPWRFAPNDGPGYSNPTFDDSTWALIRPENDKLLTDAHVANIVDGSDWSRLHLHLLNATAQLGMVITTRDGVPYEVFANGRRIEVARGFGSGDSYENRSTVIKIPPAASTVLTIHCFSGKGDLRHYDPIEKIEIGQFELISETSKLDHLGLFLNQFLIDVVISCVFLACVPFGIALFLAQRDHREYLWLATVCTMIVLDYMSRVAIYAGWVPTTNMLVNIRNFFGTALWITFLEFVSELAGTRRRVWVRVLQASILGSLILFSTTVHASLFKLTQRQIGGIITGIGVFDFISLSAFVIAVGAMMWSAFRHGRRECGIFLLPIILLPLSKLGVEMQEGHAELFGEMWTGHIGRVGFTAYQLGSLPLLAGLVGIVLYRFIRVSKDEEIAAAELEAARTVQQLLIPATQPQTPGFSVESIYLPARQVGGDFFMLLPSPGGSDSNGLLAIIGDVSGKGLQAAMVVSTIIGALRVLSSRQPGELLAHLNAALTGHISGFATCCAVLLNPDGRMTIANAGNPSPYSGGKEIPTLPGLPLGMVEGIVYEETEHTLEAGGQLTFVSDGVVEATSAVGKKLFGFERTREISSEPATAIAEAACSFGAGAPQADDITVLTISLN